MIRAFAMRNLVVTIWLLLGIWLALNVAFFATRLYVTAEPAPEHVRARFPHLVN